MRTAALPAAKSSRHPQTEALEVSMYFSGDAYYFRESYLDQQIAFGVARSVHTRRFKTRSRSKVLVESLTQAAFAFLFLCVTFAVTYMLLDVLGLDHLTRFNGGDRLLYDLNRLMATNT
jgi:hypothetical protein